MLGLGLSALLLSAVGLDECSIAARFEGPRAGESVAVAISTGRVVPVPTPLGFDYRYIESGEVRAFEFVVGVTATVGGRVDSWGLLAPRDTILVVPWEFDAACELAEFSGEDWVPAGESAVFTASTAGKFGGRRVLEVMGPSNGFPHVVHPPNDAPADRDGWASAADYYGLITSAPRTDSELSREEQLARFENAFRAGPTSLLERYPGPQWLSAVRRWARGGEASGEGGTNGGPLASARPTR